MNTGSIPSFQDVLDAYSRIRYLVHRTPVHQSVSVNSITGSELFFKCENFQKVGAFKFRGASNAVGLLSEDEKKPGVVTHSSGNHAAALALAARMNGIPAYIVMPDNSPEIKINAVRNYSGKITFCPPSLEDREKYSREIIGRTGATFIHPYDHPHVIAGQGTCAYELLSDFPQLEVLVVPTGGGGLLAGSLLAAKAMIPGIQVIAAEPLGADDAFKSFYSGKWHPSVKPSTIADGLLTSIGQINFSIMQQHLNEVIRVSDEQIIQAMELLWERMKLVVEPSGAAGLAAVLAQPDYFKNKKTGIIISGGNRAFQL